MNRSIRVFIAIFALFIMLPALAHARMPIQETRPVFDSTAAQAKFGKRCTVTAQCGDLSYVDCGSAFDGPSYYVRTDTLDPVMYCGGNCMSAPNLKKDGYCSQCPPREWTCDP